MYHCPVCRAVLSTNDKEMDRIAQKAVETAIEKAGKYTNADDVAAVTGMSNEEAALLVDKIRYQSISLKEDFTFETVLSSHYKLDILEKAKSEFVFTSEM